MRLALDERAVDVVLTIADPAQVEAGLGDAVRWFSRSGRSPPSSCAGSFHHPGGAQRTDRAAKQAGGFGDAQRTTIDLLRQRLSRQLGVKLASGRRTCSPCPVRRPPRTNPPLRHEGSCQAIVGDARRGHHRTCARSFYLAREGRECVAQRVVQARHLAVTVAITPVPLSDTGHHRAC
ncbi:MAG: hypothetical protein IPG81_06715 [Sandaracinaceae bacterium]|nr:hypothetical protein [Sandaracinaceae bacterium]